MLSCVIIDDDEYAITALEKYIVTFPDLHIVATYTDPLDALKSISKADPVDLILLDVDMPQITGIELSRAIRGKTNKLIFTTGHTKYAYDAFKVQADDYLLKPFSLGEFMISMNKIFPEGSGTLRDEFFFVKNKNDNNKIMNIRFADVVAVESKLNYVMIHTTKKNILTYMSLGEVSKIFSGHDDFKQFQRSFIISHKHIEYFNGNSIRMSNGLELNVGEFYRKSFTEFVQRHILRAERRK